MLGYDDYLGLFELLFNRIGRYLINLSSILTLLYTHHSGLIQLKPNIIFSFTTHSYERYTYFHDLTLSCEMLSSFLVTI